eukprot:197168_1
MSILEIVRTVHSDQLNTGTNHNNDKIELLEVIGGIDSVLNDYFTNENMLLTEIQLNKIHQILQNPKKKTLTTCTKINENNTGNSVQSTKQKEDKHDEFVIPLYTCDTFLYSFFSDKTANKLTKFLYHKL